MKWITSLALAGALVLSVASIRVVADEKSGEKCCADNSSVTNQSVADKSAGANAAADNTAAAITAADNSAAITASDTKSPAHESFQALRALEGTWESDKAEPDGQRFELVFHVTANGSVVTEMMGPGTKYEMLNTYHMDGQTLMMTHYCAQGMQPRMKLVSSENGTLKFEFMDCTNGQAHEGEGHMGALEITIAGDKLTEKWGFIKPGEKTPGKFETFELHRKG